MSGMAAPSEGSFGEGGEQGPCMSVRESGHSGGGVHPHMEGQESHRRAYTDDAQVCAVSSKLQPRWRETVRGIGRVCSSLHGPLHAQHLKLAICMLAPMAFSRRLRALEVHVALNG